MPPLALRTLRGTLVFALPLGLLALVATAVASPAELRVMVNFFISLVLVLAIQSFSGNSGIVSFGHVAFMGVGAYVAAIATIPPASKQANLALPSFLADHTVSFLPAIALGGVVGALVAGILGLALARMRESAMAMATIGVLVILFVVFGNWNAVTLGPRGLSGIPQSTTLYSALAFAVLTIAATRAFRESRTGMQLRASRTDPVAAEALGADVGRLRWVAWTFSGAIMGVGGALWAQYNFAFGPDHFFFASTFALLAMLVVGGFSVSGAVVGVFIVTAVFENVRLIEDRTEIYGLTQIVVALLILVVLQRRPNGLLGLSEADDILARWGERLARKVRCRPAADPEPILDGSPRRPAAMSPQRDGKAMLVMEGLVKHFDGLKALDGVSLEVCEGEIVGLIGPNGSGKTTLLNLASGVLRPTEGRTLVGGFNATGHTSHEFAHLGVGRTFQQIRLFGDMTVHENVMTGAVARGQSPERVPELLERLTLAGDAQRLAVTLSYGTQRRVEIARALAGRPKFLLLDEPAAGMNDAESDALLETIRTIRDDEGCAVLIIDHDLRLIMRLCERLYVLAQGRTICEGTPDRVRRDPGVIRAYLGTAAA